MLRTTDLARPTGLIAAAVLLLLVLSTCFASPAVATAAEAAAHLELEVSPAPTSFSAADTPNCEANTFGVVCDQFRLTAYSTGALAATGQVTLTDRLPAGLLARPEDFELVRLYPGAIGAGPEGAEEVLYNAERQKPNVSCKLAGQSVSCKVGAAAATLAPDQALQMRVPVLTAPSAASGEVNVATLATLASSSTLETPITVDSPPAFGISSLFTSLTDAAGGASTQAGAHPYEFTTRFRPQTTLHLSPESQLVPTSVEDLRDASVDLPPGLVGSAEAAAKCTQIELTTLVGCPPASRVGLIRTEPNSLAQVNSSVYNMVPEHGVAAEFGFTDIIDNPHFIYASVVPSAAGYVIRATTPETPQIALANVIATFFGDPSVRDATQELPPMFSLPSDCSGRPLLTQLHIDSWQNPGPQDAEGPVLSDPRWASASSSMPPVSGCEELRFEPSIAVKAENPHADSPTGLEVDLAVPQTSGAEELATPPLKRALVTLPEGLTVNPSSAAGLGACSMAQVGISASGQPDGAQPACPDSSKIGTLELESPALPGVLQGQIYLARQGENPFGSLLAIYLVVDDPTTGVLVKLAGRVEADPATGRLQTVVDQSPQLPFSELRTHFFAGNRAPLKTSAVCGTYTVTSALSPWSAPQSGPPATPSASFETSQPAGGGSCPTTPGAEPNHPAFTAGSISSQAGAYSPFVLHGARADGDQPITQVNVTLPKGLVGKLAGIPYCPESSIALARSREREGGGAEEAAHPACPAASEVGVVQVGAGAGPEPFYVSGHAYLTGPYKGAPLGIAIISPAVAGPFDLGDVVVRAALEVDPLTTQITAVSDPIPTILDGIPLDIRSIDLQMDRQQFTLNPTNCEKTAVTGEAVGQFGSTAALSEPFQVGGCKALAFRPKLKVSLTGSTRRAGHPALRAEVTYPKGPGYANIAYARVGLPGTEFLDQANLNHVCTQAELKTATCPKSSIYGRAKAWSPLLEAPLEGNVYLGVGFGHKLPDLVAELDGQIRVLLDGKVDTDSEKGIRSSFEVVPDAPVSRFVLSMKGGPRYGLLENTAGVCARPQKAQVKFIAQNGIVREYRQKILNGCPKKGAHGKKGGRGAAGKKGPKGSGKHKKVSKAGAGAAARTELSAGW